MAGNAAFQGFPKECLRFFEQLRNNNNKTWFDLHKADYENHVLNPARAFVSEMGLRLLEIAPTIHARPQVNGSIFRIYRDTRFSRDKTPYKDHLGIFFWEGPGGKTDSPGFYFHVEPGKLLLGAGLYRFGKSHLEAYRRAVADPKKGPALEKALKTVEKKGYEIGGRHYKRVPRGFEPDHPRADLLRHNGVHAGLDLDIPKAFFGPELTDLVYGHYKKLAEMHRWLLDLVTAPKA